MNELEKSIKNALGQLNKIDTSPFSTKGFDQYKLKISEFIYLLYYESHEVSKNNHSDTISGDHVDIASTKLFRSRRSRKINFLNSIGGLFLGATMTNIFAMTSYGVEFSVTGILLTIGTGIVGSFILGYNLLNE